MTNIPEPVESIKYAQISHFPCDLARTILILTITNNSYNRCNDMGKIFSGTTISERSTTGVDDAPPFPIITIKAIPILLMIKTIMLRLTVTMIITMNKTTW